MKRRSLLKINSLRALISGESGCISVPKGNVGPAQSKRPNILLAIADDWSWPHASIAGCRFVNTPAFDRVAREGVLFENAFVSAPSCTPSRGAILTGQWHWRLEEGANLFGTLNPKFAVYPDLLETAGYHIGFTGKGWSPGDWAVSGRTRNPAGPEYNNRRMDSPTSKIRDTDYAGNFEDFLNARPTGKPFCFWYGGHEPHRGYEEGSGLRLGKKLEDVEVPPYLPDSEVVRSDILDYAVEVEWYDTHLGRMVQILEDRGELDNTFLVVTSDNGMPFPRCKSNLYDSGTQMPLAIRWPALVKGGCVVKDFVNLCDLAPTFLEAAGIELPAAMTARSLMDVLTSGKSGWIDQKRNHVLTGKERHGPTQPDTTGGYPMRAYRIRDFLYIRNFKPERWPAGTPESPKYHYRDIDKSTTKDYIINHQNEPAVKDIFRLSFGRRPAEELYDLRKDPDQLNNVADKGEYKEIKEKLAAALIEELKVTQDPRVLGQGDVFDNYPVGYGKHAEKEKAYRDAVQKKKRTTENEK